MEESLYPYIIFLPKKKSEVLRGIFGSSVPIDILNFSIEQGISEKIYQQKLINTLNHSNKTVIEYLKKLSELEIITENMEKIERKNRSVWLKFYRLSDLGKWFALLLTDERNLSKEKKTEIIHVLFKSYVHWLKELHEKMGLNKTVFKELLINEINDFEKRANDQTKQIFE